MPFRCPDCAGPLVEKSIESILGIIDGWYCSSCDSFYEKKEFKKALMAA